MCHLFDGENTWNVTGRSVARDVVRKKRLGRHVQPDRDRDVLGQCRDRCVEPVIDGCSGAGRAIWRS
jgi:hypothetical protein